MIRIASLILLLLSFADCMSQDSLRRSTKNDYRKKEEIIYDNKRYRLYNNYVTLGGGIALSTIREGQQRAAGVDFNFHIRREYFQAGVLLSGYQFFANNHVQGHLGYGKRFEHNRFNFAIYGGPSFYQGVLGRAGQPEVLYGGAGAYFNAQYVQKLTYDVGAGIDLFVDLGFATGASGREQALYGAKIILFFSGAYRGPKRNYNPNVRSENPNG